MFVWVTSPLLMALTILEAKVSTKDHEVRVKVGVLAQIQLTLIDKRFVTERNLGITSDQKLAYRAVNGLENHQ